MLAPSLVMAPSFVMVAILLLLLLDIVPGDVMGRMPGRESSLILFCCYVINPLIISYIIVCLDN